MDLCDVKTLKVSTHRLELCQSKRFLFVDYVHTGPGDSAHNKGGLTSCGSIISCK